MLELRVMLLGNREFIYVQKNYLIRKNEHVHAVFYFYVSFVFTFISLEYNL